MQADSPPRARQAAGADAVACIGAVNVCIGAACFVTSTAISGSLEVKNCSPSGRLRGVSGELVFLSSNKFAARLSACMQRWFFETLKWAGVDFCQCPWSLDVVRACCSPSKVVTHPSPFSMFRYSKSPPPRHARSRSRSPPPRR